MHFDFHRSKKSQRLRNMSSISGFFFNSLCQNASELWSKTLTQGLMGKAPRSAFLGGYCTCIGLHLVAG